MMIDEYKNKVKSRRVSTCFEVCFEVCFEICFDFSMKIQTAANHVLWAAENYIITTIQISSYLKSIHEIVCNENNNKILLSLIRWSYMGVIWAK